MKPVKSDESSNTTERYRFNDFLIWVDGVGGYLVCVGKENKIGQAIAQSSVSIAVRGDIDREHALIRSVAGDHVIEPIGAVWINDQSVDTPAALGKDQVFRMGKVVEMRYRRPHSLSTTAVLDFESRHRTFPWSDAVLLAGDSIVLGPAKRNHVYCAKWPRDVILYRQSGVWFCRSKVNLIVDGVAQVKPVPLAGNSRIESQSFSMSFESVPPPTKSVR